jgi:hypothetical protein
MALLQVQHRQRSRSLSAPVNLTGKAKTRRGISAFMGIWVLYCLCWSFATMFGECKFVNAIERNGP